MYITDILKTADQIADGKGKQFAIVNSEQETIYATENFGEASTLREVGNFFLETISEYSLSSKDISLFQRAFKAIKIGTDKNYEILKKIIYISKPLNTAEEIEKKLEAALDETIKFEETTTLTFKAIFLIDKRFILERVIEETGTTVREIEFNLRKMSLGATNKIMMHLGKLQKNEDLKNDDGTDSRDYRLLKMRLLGGVRFADTARQAKFRIAESPKDEKENSPNISVKTKTRFNVPPRHGVGHLKKPTIERLKSKRMTLNETTLSQALFERFKTLQWQLIKLAKEINLTVDQVNKTLEEGFLDLEKTLKSINTIIEKTDVLVDKMIECSLYITTDEPRLKAYFCQVCKDNMEESLHNKLAKNKFAREGSFNQFFGKVKLPPYFNTSHEIGDIEHDIRNSIFEAAKLQRVHKWKAEDARTNLHHMILHKIAEREWYSDEIKKDLIQVTLRELLEKDIETTEVIDMFFST